jgi:hypothetical protein
MDWILDFSRFSVAGRRPRIPRGITRALLFFSVPFDVAGAGEEQIEDLPVTAQMPPPHWVDTSHQFATNRAQALVQWMDDFFGASVRDAERADSFIRSIFINDWDQRDSHDLGLRLRGQISLPKISRSVDLVFSGEEAEQTLTEEERASENDIGLRLNVRDGTRSRFDATVSLSSGPALLPGVRYRYQLPLSDNSWGRFTQRLQYHTDDGYRSLTNIDLNRALNDHSLLRWGARMRYREDRGFWDWNTGINYRRWVDDHDRYPSAIEYYVAMSGRDDPQSFSTNYRVGLLYRRQFFRDYLFFEVEPNYNWRRDEFEDRREGVAGIVFRLEVMLDDDLVTRARN